MKKTKKTGKSFDRKKEHHSNKKHVRPHHHTEPKHQNSIEGTISISSKGTGYVTPIGGARKENDIEISYENLNTALHGDTVQVVLASHKKTDRIGKVAKIITRAKIGFAGTLETENGKFFLKPADTRMYTDILIPKGSLGGAKVGEKVFGTITTWTNSEKSPEGKITRVLGMPFENNAEMEAIALERGFDEQFPENVEREVKDIAEAASSEFPHEIKKRRDFRTTTTFTIDPEDAKDFDDAISIKQIDADTYEIGVHIADVSHYVRKRTALDAEAYRRGTSVYLVDRTVPMLPEILSNDLCSLKPDVDRFTMSAVFAMRTNGDVLSEWYGKTIIHSDKRFTYEGAQKVLDDKKGMYYEELHTLNTIAKSLHKIRFKNGAMSLEQEEVKFALDEKGKPIRVYKKSRGDTHKLIEELMLLANRKVAESITKGDKKGKELSEKERIFVYRIHDLPNKEKMADLAHLLKTMGYNVSLKDGVIPPKELNQVLESMEGKDEKEFIQTAVIRSMAKAIYSTGNIGHYGLAFEHYTHFTSPIRRYPDLVVHRLLEEYLKKQHIGREHWHEYEKICHHSSEREKYAADAERASIKYKQVEYMTERIGQTFQGVVTGITEWGMYVEEKETKCEGMIKLRDLGDDYFIFDEKNMTLVGKKTKKTFRVGDKFQIRVANANLERKIIDYMLV